jgi:hypothetical protein
LSRHIAITGVCTSRGDTWRVCASRGPIGERAGSPEWVGLLGQGPLVLFNRRRPLWLALNPPLHPLRASLTGCEALICHQLANERPPLPLLLSLIDCVTLSWRPLDNKRLCPTPSLPPLIGCGALSWRPWSNERLHQPPFLTTLIGCAALSWRQLANERPPLLLGFAATCPAHQQPVPTEPPCPPQRRCPRNHLRKMD